MNSPVDENHVVPKEEQTFEQKTKKMNELFGKNEVLVIPKT